MSNGWHYLSFVVTDPVERFAGGCIVRGDDVVEAVKEAHRLGCNPGGDVLGVPVPGDLMPPARYVGRLLTKAEIDECWNDCVRIGDIKDELDIPNDAHLCASHNAVSDTSTKGEVTK